MPITTRARASRKHGEHITSDNNIDIEEHEADYDVSTFLSQQPMTQINMDDEPLMMSQVNVDDHLPANMSDEPPVIRASINMDDSTMDPFVSGKKNPRLLPPISTVATPVALSPSPLSRPPDWFPSLEFRARPLTTPASKPAQRFSTMPMNPRVTFSAKTLPRAEDTQVEVSKPTKVAKAKPAKEPKSVEPKPKAAKVAKPTKEPKSAEPKPKPAKVAKAAKAVAAKPAEPKLAKPKPARVAKPKVSVANAPRGPATHKEKVERRVARINAQILRDEARMEREFNSKNRHQQVHLFPPKIFQQLFRVQCEYVADMWYEGTVQPCDPYSTKKTSRPRVSVDSAALEMIQNAAEQEIIILLQAAAIDSRSHNRVTVQDVDIRSAVLSRNRVGVCGMRPGIRQDNVYDESGRLNTRKHHAAISGAGQRLISFQERQKKQRALRIEAQRQDTVARQGDETEIEEEVSIMD